jgi:hypothetical protein
MLYLKVAVFRHGFAASSGLPFDKEANNLIVFLPVGWWRKRSLVG